jgi:hypothetical protein
MSERDTVRVIFDPADAPDPDQVYANYLRTCTMLGVEPVPRECTAGLLAEQKEVAPDSRTAG